MLCSISRLRRTFLTLSKLSLVRNNAITKSLGGGSGTFKLCARSTETFHTFLEPIAFGQARSGFGTANCMPRSEGPPNTNRCFQCLAGAGRGGRTPTRGEPRRILSPLRLPVPPSRLGSGYIGGKSSIAHPAPCAPSIWLHILCKFARRISDACTEPCGR
jgi:hypothetical protein